MIMPPYTAFTAYTIVVAASIPKPFISTVRQLNMANTSEIFSDVSSEVDTCSARLSAVETEADAGSVLDRRTRASTAKERESPLKRSYHDALNEGRASKRPKRNDQNNSLSTYKTSDSADPTSIGRPLSTQPPTTQGFGATAARSAKARSIRHSAPKNTRSEANAPAKVVLDGKARVVKRGRGEGKSSNLSTLGSPPLRRRTPTWHSIVPNSAVLHRHLPCR
jgi:hypothetical protein